MKMKHVPNKFQIQVVEGYFPEIRRWLQMPEIFRQQQEEMVVGPMTKFHLMEAYLSFLLQLLYHNRDPTLTNLEKGLRYLLTILGDICWILGDSSEKEVQFKNLLADLEAVANQVGRFLHFLLFSTEERCEDQLELDTVVNYTDLLIAKLVSSDITTPDHDSTPRTSILNSSLFLSSLIDDLDHMLNWEDDRVAGVKEIISLFHQGLLVLCSSINDMKSLQIGEPMMRIGDIALQAEYVITALLVGDAPLSYVINKLTYLIHKIQLVRMELQVMTETYKFGGLEVAKCSPAHPTSHDIERKNGSNDVMVGFEDETIHILDELVGGTMSLQVISIIGMPGLGKTTLARKLYNHLLVRDRFDKLTWLVVSQTYVRQSILADILMNVNSDFGKDRILDIEEEGLVEYIHKTLKGRRYLIVMDDIWDSNVWDDLQRCFPEDGNGSRILLTSRNKDVVPSNSNGKVHELPFLSNEQCWELFEKKVFGNRSCPLQLQPIGRKIATNCCGLPLTVIAIAGILSTVDEEESAWEEVEGSLASYIKDGEDNNVMQILELSYKHLPCHLKPCFLLFGVFKEDKEISAKKLMRLWMAEGFILNKNGKSRETIAEEYLLELIDKSLVLVAKRRSDGRGVKACMVHDLFWDLCLKISEEESFLKYVKNKCHTIHDKGHRFRALGDSAALSLCQHVRCFYGDRQTSSLYVRDMRLLRVLHSNDMVSNVGLFGLQYLVNLRLLITPVVPTLIEKLINLEYLIVLSRIYIPSSIGSMKKLRHLQGPSLKYGIDWSGGCRTNSLEYLSSITIMNEADEELLQFSPNLGKLKCEYRVPHLDLWFLTRLHSLSLSFYSCKLEAFEFPASIRKLTLFGSRLSWEKMSIVGRLENLEVLKLCEDAFEGERWDTGEGEFQKLRFLLLDHIYLSQWNVASSEHFPKLEQLIVRFCWNLEEIPSDIGEITTLELMEVTGYCPESQGKSAERIKQEQREMGNVDLKFSIDYRFFSDQWRTWAACFIQAAWRQYCRKKLQDSVGEEEVRLQQYKYWARKGGRNSPSLGATIYASRFSANALRVLRRYRNIERMQNRERMQTKLPPQLLFATQHK